MTPVAPGPDGYQQHLDRLFEPVLREVDRLRGELAAATQGQPSRSRQRREAVRGEAAPPSGAATPGQADAPADVLASLPRQWDAQADATAHWDRHDVSELERAAYATGLRDCASELRKVLAAQRPAPAPGPFPDGCTCLELEDGQRSPDPDCPAHHSAPAPDDGRTPGQVAYEAYGKAIPEEAFPEPLRGMGWTSWEEIPEWERLAYEAAARAVAARQPGTAWRLLEELRERMADLAAECEGWASGMRDGAAKTVVGGPDSPAVAAWNAENDTWRQCAAMIRQVLEP